jgi:glycosyltransferase involved in cell wall biosynthesis
MITPLVSILIPAHNAEKWIADTLRSAIAQTWERKEIIVVDDGSSDRTINVARAFESHDVRVISQRNLGAAAARNTAFSLCHGDYIQWLDADDLLAPDKIARQLETIPDGRTLLSGSWGSFMYRPYKARFTPSSLWQDLSPAEWLIHKLSENVFMQTAVWLVSRELTEAAGEWDTRMHADDDGEYFCRVLLASDRVHFVPDAKVYYRNSGSVSLSYIGESPKKMEALWLSIKLHIGYLRSLEDSLRVHAACLEYLRISLVNFTPEQSGIRREAEQLAMELGGKLGEAPRSWKFTAMERLLGWRIAKTSQRWIGGSKWWAVRQWDRLLLHLEGKAHRDCS